MRMITAFLLWLAGVAAGAYLLINILSLGNIWHPETLIIVLPVIILFLGAFPTARYYLVRRIFFYAGAISWMILTGLIARSMNPPAFSIFFLTYSGISITLLTAASFIDDSGKKQSPNRVPVTANGTGR